MLKNKYFLRMRFEEENEEDVWFSAGKILEEENSFLLVSMLDWDDGTPSDVNLSKGTVIHHMMELSSWHCSFFDDLDALIKSHDECCADDKDEFATHWESKMSEI